MIEDAKKTRKFRSFKSDKASKPNISRKPTFSPLATTGGVLGKVKLKIPNTAEAIAVIKKVFFRAPAAKASVVSQKKT